MHIYLVTRPGRIRVDETRAHVVIAENGTQALLYAAKAAMDEDPAVWLEAAEVELIGHSQPDRSLGVILTDARSA